MSARIEQSAWVQLSLTPEVGARWCGEPFPASSVRSNKAFLKDCAPCVSTLFLHSYGVTWLVRVHALPLGIATFSDAAAVWVSKHRYRLTPRHRLSLRLAIGTRVDL